jgi:hypothetical protein
MMIRSAKVLNSAKGQPCAARFPGICVGGTETTVFAHLNGAAFGKGAGVKAHDVFGFHSCWACHNYYDVGHGTFPVLSDAELSRYLLQAVCETWLRCITAGIIVVPLDVQRLSSDRPVKPRPPREQRSPVGPSRPLESRSNWPAKGTRKIQSRAKERAST